MNNRNTYIGGSDCAGVLGLSRWNTPLQVWAEKTGQVLPKDISDKVAVKLGNKLEGTVAELFMEETGKKVQRVNETIFHQKYDFLGANLDRRIVGEDAILECKTCSAWKAKEWEGQEIPQEYILQCYHYLAITGKQKCYIAVLIGNQDFKWKEIKRDDKLILDIIKKEVHFWENFVVPKVMPFTIKSSDSEILSELFQDVKEDSQIELDDKARAILENIESMKQDKFSLEKQIEQQENEIKALLKENQSAICGDYSITWKMQNVKRINIKQLKSVEPEIYEKYLNENKSRVLRITKKENENGKSN